MFHHARHHCIPYEARGPFRDCVVPRLVLDVVREVLASLTLRPQVERLWLSAPTGKHIPAPSSDGCSDFLRCEETPRKIVSQTQPQFAEVTIPWVVCYCGAVLQENVRWAQALHEAKDLFEERRALSLRGQFEAQLLKGLGKENRLLSYRLGATHLFSALSRRRIPGRSGADLFVADRREVPENLG